MTPSQGNLVRLPTPTVVRALNRLSEQGLAKDVLEDAITRNFQDRIALVSSFGAESAPLLHMVSRIDPATPVLFVETQMLFPQTLRYQQELADSLGLQRVHLIRPDVEEIMRDDPGGNLHVYAPDTCCNLRKTRPLARALRGYDAWITGRKRYQSASRADIKVFEADEAGRIKINPLANWDAATLRAYMERFDLPLHPLVAQGYPSIGCEPCTTPAGPGESARAGRWRGREKEECGIHFENGKAQRRPA